MAGKRNGKIVKYHKPFQINIGIIVFVLIFLYLMYFVFSYFTTAHTSFYEVTQGTIAQDTVFRGLILRQETVYYAETGGYINYYYKDGSKASGGSYVYSIDETGDYYQQMLAANDGTLSISDEAYQQLESVANQYTAAYSDNEFYQAYQFRYDIEAALMEALSASAGTDAALAEAASLQAFTAPEAGVVVYNTDGLEGITVDTFTEAMFDSHTYEKINFLQRQTVSPGDAVYKLITSEKWNVVIPISDSLASDLAEEENVKVQFKKDNSTAWATCEIINREGSPYLALTFQNSMIRFAGDRFIQLELLITDSTGLKIPNSAITTKKFITVPKEYITKGGDSNNDGVLVERTIEEKKVTEFVATSLFYETDTVYYIDSDEIALGDVVVMPDSNQHYTLQDTAELEGVYNINRGYAVFKRIEKLFENEEYTIVESGTSYGISLYDHIALDSSTVNENEILH